MIYLGLTESTLDPGQWRQEDYPKSASRVLTDTINTPNCETVSLSTGNVNVIMFLLPLASVGCAN
jgi:hypothetical protein